jgi:PilZ domain-containing protein
VMSHTGDYTRIVAKPAASEGGGVPVGSGGGGGAAASATAVAPAEAARPLDWHGTRRAPRHRVRTGVEIQLDGNPANVVDLSTVGAQVISSTILRPNQKVRVSIPNDDFVMRFRGAIAWAKFELPKPNEAPRYRAGVEFTDADATAVEQFCDKHRKGE